MKASMQKLVDQVFDPPIYVVKAAQIGFHVDKLEYRDKKWWRVRYFVNNDQCSCLGWLKFKKCKHVDMVKGNFGGSGVSADAALSETDRIIELVGDFFPEDSKKWKPDENKLPSEVKAITFHVSKGIDADAIISLRKWKFGSLAIEFRKLIEEKE